MTLIYTYEIQLVLGPVVPGKNICGAKPLRAMKFRHQDGAAGTATTIHSPNKHIFHIKCLCSKQKPGLHA
jgi:hypothetical protein